MVGSVVRIIVCLGVLLVCATAGLPFLAVEEDRGIIERDLIRRFASLTRSDVEPVTHPDRVPFRTGRVLLIDGDALDRAPDEPCVDHEQTDLDRDLAAESVQDAETVIAIRRRRTVDAACPVFDPIRGELAEPSGAPGRRTFELTIADIATGRVIGRIHVLDRDVKGAINAMISRMPVAMVPAPKKADGPGEGGAPAH